jgi:rhamnosyltransferase
VTKKKISDIDFTNLATITITFNPNIEDLLSQLYILPESSIKVIVDNASTIQHWDEIQLLSHQFRNIYLIRSKVNLGLATAINRGAEFISNLVDSPEFILLLDQDSIPQHKSIEKLLMAFKNLQKNGHPVGCVGPLLTDLTTGLTHGFHQSSKFRWTRVYPTQESITPIKCSSLNGSGTLMSLELFQKLGGLDEQFFIDHVDTEWSFRIISNGYQLWGIPNSIFGHSMGETSKRFWLFGWRVWPVRSPQRHYYLYKNAIILMQRPYIPKVWKIWAIMKLALTTTIVVLIDSSRIQQIKNMWKGIRTGLRNKN